MPTNQPQRQERPSPSPSFAERMRLYRENRARFPVEDLRRHAGQWVAFSADGRRLVAADEDYARLEQVLSAAGQDPRNVFSSNSLRRTLASAGPNCCEPPPPPGWIGW